MFKKLILFCTFAIFMLAVGGAVTPVWAHADCDDPEGKGKHSPGHPHCDDITGSTDTGNLYLVWVDGLCHGPWNGNTQTCGGDWVWGACVFEDGSYGLWGGGWDDDEDEPSCPDGEGDWVGYDLGMPPYSGHDPVGNYEKNVAVVVNLQYINMDLGFFQDYFSVDGASPCFDGAPEEGRQTVLSIENEKVKGKAEGALKAGYVFSGFGTDGTDGIGYRLTLSSGADPNTSSGWRPTVKTTAQTGDDNRFDVTFDHWELSSTKDIGCNGSGGYPDATTPFNTTFSIIKTN